MWEKGPIYQVTSSQTMVPLPDHLLYGLLYLTVYYSKTEGLKLTVYIKQLHGVIPLYGVHYRPLYKRGELLSSVDIVVVPSDDN